MDEKQPIKVESLNVISDGKMAGSAPMKINYPGNSHKVKDAGPQKEEVKKIIKGGLVQKKESIGKKFKESLFGGTLVAAGHYIVYDVLIPALQALVVDSIRGGSERLIYGEKIPSGIRRDGNRSYVNYQGYSNQGQGIIRRPQQPTQDFNRAARHNFDMNILETKGDAEDVLSQLVGLIEQYGVASVGDMNCMLGITGDFVDQKWGWSNLSSAYVSRVREGYLINLPKPGPLE